MKKFQILVVILLLISCKDSDDPNPTNECTPASELLETITSNDSFTSFAYDNDGNIVKVETMSPGKTRLYTEETFAWVSGKLTGYQRLSNSYGESSDTPTSSFISEKCTYEYKGNQIVKIISQFRDFPEDDFETDEIEIAYNDMGLPYSFHSNKQGLFNWIYVDDPEKINVIHITKGEGAYVLDLTYSDLRNQYPETYQYARVYKRYGMYDAISANATSKYISYSSNGNVSTTINYTYTTDSSERIITLTPEVSSCMSCNGKNTLTYACVD
ncbi:MAG TPA: hypothetical protein VD884_21225 [Ohtaekwangia sp.]|nr:hypothetical protein [Ohtaekwangia sp.]